MENNKTIKHKGGETQSLSFTAHTFLPDLSYPETNRTLYGVLDDMGALNGRIKRRLFKDSVGSRVKPASFKNDYLKSYGITARQFNAIRYDLDGNIRSAVEVLKLRVSTLEEKIKSAAKWVKSKEARIRKIQKEENLSGRGQTVLLHSLRSSLHNKRRKLHSMEVKLAGLKNDRTNGRVRICFGSQGLFRKQFNLDGNGYVSHEEWLSDWKRARSSQAFCLGSKDETAGNQTCALSGDGSLRIRVPDCLRGKYGKYIVVPEVHYAYGQELIDQALLGGQALTHRFVRTAKGWYLHTSIELPGKEPVTFKPTDIGCIGVDVNEKEIAVCETDRFGNLVKEVTYPACVKDRNTDQTEARYGDICKLIVETAVSTGKPIAHETLDFGRKKAALKGQGVSYARMLSGFAYCTFLTMLDRKAFRSGVRVFSDNPAYTSVIGKMNYMSRYGISPHEAAALVIARRIQGYSESPEPARTASPLPVRNREEHVWKYWRRLKDSGACEHHHRLYRRRPLQGSTGCAEPQTPSSSRSTAHSSRPPADIGQAPGATPITNIYWDLCESGRKSLTLTGSSTVRLPS